jgi:hypothetical protein
VRPAADMLAWNDTLAWDCHSVNIMEHSNKYLRIRYTTLKYS